MVKGEKIPDLDEGQKHRRMTMQVNKIKSIYIPEKGKSRLDKEIEVRQGDNDNEKSYG